MKLEIRGTLPEVRQFTAFLYAFGLVERCTLPYENADRTESLVIAELDLTGIMDIHFSGEQAYGETAQGDGS